jgi:hypothetical protein
MIVQIPSSLSLRCFAIELSVFSHVCLTVDEQLLSLSLSLSLDPTIQCKFVDSSLGRPRIISYLALLLVTFNTYDKNLRAIHLQSTLRPRCLPSSGPHDAPLITSLDRHTHLGPRARRPLVCKSGICFAYTRLTLVNSERITTIVRTVSSLMKPSISLSIHQISLFLCLSLSLLHIVSKQLNIR